MKKVMAAALLLAASFATPPEVAAQQAKPLAVEELLDLPSPAPFDPGDFSPDGTLFAYTVIDPVRQRALGKMPEWWATGISWFGFGGDIWIADLGSGEARRITGGVGSNWGPRWSPDGDRLAFVSDRGAEGIGPAGVWIWERSSDELRRVGTIEIQPSLRPIHWTADGRSLIASVLPRGVTRAEFAAAFQGVGAPDPESAVTARVYSFDPDDPGAGPQTEQVNLDLVRRGLVLLDVATGDVRWIAPDSRIPGHVPSPDRQRVAWAVLLGTEAPGSSQYIVDIVVHDLSSGEAWTVAKNVHADPWSWSLSWSPAGDAVAFRTAGPTARDEVFVVPAHGGEPVRVAEGPSLEGSDRLTDAPVWDPDGHCLYFTRDGVVWRALIDGTGAAEFASSEGREITLLATTAGTLWTVDGEGRTAVVETLHSSTKQAGFGRLDLERGTVTPVLEQDVYHGGYAVAPVLAPERQRLAFVAEDAMRPPEWWTVGPDLSAPRRISRIAPADFDDRTFGKVSVIEWTSLHGETLRGTLVYPAGYQEDRRYPLIVRVYGGSDLSNWRNRFGVTNSPVDNAQLYATRGYALLFADSELRVGTPMADLLASVMPGVDRAIGIGVADPERLGVTGHSYGGYSTLALIAQTPRFAAAVMSAGLGNLVGGYGQLDTDGTNYGLPWAEQGQGRMGGSPWEYRSRYIENSPFFYLDRVRTPLLIIHGEKDTAVQPFLAAEVFVGLRRLGQEVTYALYMDEEHWPGTWNYSNQVDVVDRTIAWFDRHLKEE